MKGRVAGTLPYFNNAYGEYYFPLERFSVAFQQADRLQRVAGLPGLSGARISM